MVGADGLRANVTVEYELASSETTQETYDPNGSVVLTSQISEDRALDSGAQGVPGTPSNVPGANAQGTAAAALGNTAGQIGQRTENKTFAVSKAVHHVVQPPGGIKKLAAAVLELAEVELKRKAGERELEEETLGTELAQPDVEVKRALAIKKQIIERVKKNPDAASRLIENWVRQGEV